MSKELEALERLMTNYYEMCQDLGNNDDQYQRCNLTSERATIEKALKALNEIVVLYDKWLGNGMSDYEFFTLLNDIKYKYGLGNEVLK